jgi:hypothetical protein
MGRLRSRLFVALTLLQALLVSAAPLWHHHDHECLEDHNRHSVFEFHSSPPIESVEIHSGDTDDCTDGCPICQVLTLPSLAPSILVWNTSEGVVASVPYYRPSSAFAAILGISSPRAPPASSLG